jgi:hypothetical protein
LRVSSRFARYLDVYIQAIPYIPLFRKYPVCPVLGGIYPRITRYLAHIRFPLCSTRGAYNFLMLCE